MARTNGTGGRQADVVVPEQRTDPAAHGATGVDPVRQPALRDRVRWGPVWAGALVATTTFVVMQLLFFALGWLDLGFDGAGSATATAVVSAVLALVAFLLGGIAAAGTALWRSAADGMVNGLLVWALSVAGLLLLGVAGGTALVGPLATLVSQSQVLPGSVPVDPATAVSVARQSAGWGALGLGLAAAASALGGMVGAKLWPTGDAARRG